MAAVSWAPPGHTGTDPIGPVPDPDENGSGGAATKSQTLRPSFTWSCGERPLPSSPTAGRGPLANHLKARVVAWLALIASLGVELRAGAQESAPADVQSHAAQLFDQGIEAQRLGQLQPACELFAASATLHATPHSLLQLGNCSEPKDLVAALGHFEAALALADDVDDPARQEAYRGAARQRIDALAARVPTLTVQPSPTPGVRVELVGGSGTAGEQSIELVAGVGAPQRLNPGRYLVRATAPGAVSYERAIHITEGARVHVQLPALLPAVQPALASGPAPGAIAAPGVNAQSQPPPEDRGASTAWRFEPLPLVLAGGGVLLIAAGVVTGQMSSSARSTLEQECGPPDEQTGLRPCDPSLSDTKAQVENYALASDILWVTGALSVAVGITLFAIDQSSPPSQLEASCWGAGCEVSFRGRF